jgi:hypothetical protein
VLFYMGMKAGHSRVGKNRERVGANRVLRGMLGHKSDEVAAA